MNYSTKRNVWFSFGIAAASIALTAGLYYLIEAVNGSALITINDGDAPIFSYLGATLGISVAIVASLSTIFLALQAMGIAKEQAIMSAREAYIEDVRDFRADSHEAERLLLELVDKSLQHARAVQSFLIFRLPEYSRFADYESEAELARQLGMGAFRSALLASHVEPEKKLRRAVEEIYNVCKAQLSADGSEDHLDYYADYQETERLIREQIECVANIQLETPEKRKNFLKELRTSIREELISVWRGRGEEVVTRSKDDLVAAMANTVNFLLGRERGFIFAELMARNLDKPHVETALQRVTDLVGVDELTREPVHLGLDRLRYFVTVANERSVVADDDLRPNQLEIPSRADGRLSESLHMADPFLPRIFPHRCGHEPWRGRPHATIDYVEAEDTGAGINNALSRSYNRHPAFASGGEHEYFSFLVVILGEILNLTDAREAIETHLVATGMPADLAKTASISYARTIRPSFSTKISRHIHK